MSHLFLSFTSYIFLITPGLAQTLFSDKSFAESPRKFKYVTPWHGINLVFCHPMKQKQSHKTKAHKRITIMCSLRHKLLKISTWYNLQSFDNPYSMPFHNSDSVFDLKYQGCVVLHALKNRNRSYFQLSLQQADLDTVRKWLYHLDTLK